MQLSSLFTSNMNDPRQRYIHFDGSSAYSHGFRRLTERNDLRIGLLAAFGCAAVKLKQVGFDADALQAAFKLATLGGSALFGAALYNSIGRIAHNYFGGRLQDDKVYDRTGEARSPEHEVERIIAVRTLPFALGSAAVLTPVIGAMWGVYGLKPYDVYGDFSSAAVTLLYVNVLQSVHRYRQIQTERISLADAPPIEEKKTARAGKRKLAPVPLAR